MKKFQNTLLRIGIAISLIAGISLLFNKIGSFKSADETQSTDNEFQNFLSKILSLEESFQNQLKISNVNLKQGLKMFENKNELDSGFKLEALIDIKKTQRALEEFKHLANSSKNSKNFNVRELAKEFIIFYNCAKLLLEHHYNFISSPHQYVSSCEGVENLEKCLALYQEEYNHLIELIQKLKHIETSASLESSFVEFKFSKTEMKAIGKWKKTSIEKMVADALDGDAAALYIIGMSNLYGLSGFSINVEKANQYFSASASLGFAPAMDKIKFTYLEDNENPFLVLVYTNLTASFGHNEFTMVYHNLRKECVDKCGQAMINEVERITTEKQNKIYETMDMIEKAENKKELIANILFIEQGIIGEDIDLGGEYWAKFFDKRVRQ